MAECAGESSGAGVRYESAESGGEAGSGDAASLESCCSENSAAYVHSFPLVCL